MSAETSFALSARSKLHLSIGSKGDGDLHRWVLLKNSILSSSQSILASETGVKPGVNSVSTSYDEDLGEEESVVVGDDADSFYFPDADAFADTLHDDNASSEAEWLDSLLESLEEDDSPYPEVTVDILPVEDDDELNFSPLSSPLSSSEDLIAQPAYYPAPIAVPYPVPYPPFQQYSIEPLCELSVHFADALPYYDTDDAEILSVPDAIDDDSDDESDAPATPSLGRSRDMAGIVDPASIPLPLERSRLRPPPQVYIDSDHTFFNAFELDPLPFPQHHSNTYNHHFQEC